MPLNGNILKAQAKSALLRLVSLQAALQLAIDTLMPCGTGIPMGLGAGFKLIDKDKDKEREKEKDSDKARSSKVSLDKEEPKSRRSPEEPSHEHSHAGWTSLVEDWLCHGAGIRVCSPTTSDISIPKPLSARGPVKERKGPYQLLIKERMMGIYMAVYIHRDLRPFVRGMCLDEWFIFCS